MTDIGTRGRGQGGPGSRDLPGGGSRPGARWTEWIALMITPSSAASSAGSRARPPRKMLRGKSSKEAAIAKLVSSNAATDNAGGHAGVRRVRLHGRVRGRPVLPGAKILETSEVQRMLIARQLGL